MKSRSRDGLAAKGLFSLQSKKYLTSDLNTSTKEMSYLFPAFNSNNRRSFGQTIAPNCTNNSFRMQGRIKTSRMSTNQGGIVNVK